MMLVRTAQPKQPTLINALDSFSPRKRSDIIPGEFPTCKRPCRRLSVHILSVAYHISQPANTHKTRVQHHYTCVAVVRKIRRTPHTHVHYSASLHSVFCVCVVCM